MKRGGDWNSFWGKVGNEFTNPQSDLRSGRFAHKVSHEVNDPNSSLNQNIAAAKAAASAAASMYKSAKGGRMRGHYGGGHSGGGMSGRGRSGGGRSGGASAAQMAVRAAVARDPSKLSMSPGALAWRKFHAAERAKGVPFPTVVTAWRAMQGKGPKRSMRMM